MSFRDRSTLSTLATVVLLAVLALFLRQPGEREDGLSTAFPEPRGPLKAASAGGKIAAPTPTPTLPPSQLRDALSQTAAATAVPKPSLAPIETDWNSLWSEASFPMMVASRDKHGRIHVGYSDEPGALHAAILPPGVARALKARLAARRGEPSPTPAVGLGDAEPEEAAVARGRAARQLRPRRARKALAGEEEAEPEEEPPEDLEDLTPAAIEGRVRSYFSTLERRKAERDRRRAARIRATLRSLLGKGILRPPKGNPRAPRFEGLGSVPEGPDGRRLETIPLTPKDLEGIKPPNEEPGYKTWYRDGHKPDHWHAGNQGDFFHRKAVWGLLVARKKWGWLLREEGHWWTGGRATPLIWHADRWWWREDEGWFLLHRGQAWAYRFFTDLQRDGLFEPDSKARVIYSDDAKRVALVIPGQETIVYDVETRQEVGRIEQGR